MTAGARSVARLAVPAALAVLALAGPARAELEVARALLTGVAIGGVGLRLGERLGVGSSRAERALFAAVLGLAVATAWATVLGLAGALARVPFLIGLALGHAGLEAARARRPDVPSVTAETGDDARSWRWAAAAALAASLAVLAHDARAHRLLEPGVFHYDDASYHLPAAVTWIQHRDLRMLRLDAGDVSTSFYPVGGELASWMLLAPFSGSDVLARWSQLPAAAVLLLGVWIASRRLGARPAGAAAALLLVLSIPRLFPDTALSAGNDLWLAAWSSAAFVALLELAARRSRGAAVALGAALGLLLGTKYLALTLLPWLAAAAALILGTPEPSRAALRAAARRLALILVVALALGGVTYARNAVLTGNPVYPQPVRVGALEILPGLEAGALEARREVEGASSNPLQVLAGKGALLGAPVAALLLPAALALPVLALLLRRRLGSAARAFFAASLAPAWQLLVFTALVHDQRDVRYLLTAPAFVAVGLAALLNRAPRPLPLLLGTALGAAAAIQVLVPRGGLGVQAWGAALAVAALAASRRIAARAALPAVALGGLVVIAALPRTMARYEESRLRHQPIAAAFARLHGGPTAVAYSGGNRPYFLFGNRLENRVEIVPAHGPPSARFYGIEVREPAPGFPKPRTWLRNLAELGVEWVVLDPEPPAPLRRRWMAARPDRFTLVAEAGGRELWRVSAPVAAGAPPDPARPGYGTTADQ